MTRVSLQIRRSPHQTSMQAGHSLTSIRVIAELSLARSGGWGEFFTAIVDTGAPLSMFPRDVWEGARFKALGRVRAGGIVARDECRIPAILARVPCVLSDGVRSIGPLDIDAYLAETDSAPCLLGMAGFLEKSMLAIHVVRNRAYVRAG